MELKIPLQDWRSFPLADRAQIMARNYLSNMISTIDKHYDAQDENMKKQANK